MKKIIMFLVFHIFNIHNNNNNFSEGVELNEFNLK